MTEVYIDSLSNLYLVADRNDSVDIANTHPRQVSLDELSAALTRIQSLDSLRAIALYADEKVEYGKVVGVLDMAARARLRMVLATRASEAPAAGDANMRR